VKFMARGSRKKAKSSRKGKRGITKEKRQEVIFSVVDEKVWHPTQKIKLRKKRKMKGGERNRFEKIHKAE